MNIEDSSAIRPCTSCGMCGAVCPTGAIDISLNRDGFYRPSVNPNICIDCGLCVKSCYRFDNDIKHTETTAQKRLYAASAKDSSILQSTTSGGIGDILARELIKQGYKCIGVSYDSSSNCAVGHVATTEDDTLPFRSSKYIQSYSVDAFKSLVKECKTHKYAVFGLPCHIYAIHRFLSSRGIRDNHLLIDLYCHGCPSLNLWKKYVGETVKKVNGKGVVSVNFRSKVRGWGNFYVVVVVEGVRYPVIVVSPRINDSFYEMFFSDLILNDSCYSCELRSTLEYTDIRLGDFWGKSYVMNNKGVSGVTIATVKGENVFETVKGQIDCQPQDFENFLPYQGYGKTYRCRDDLRKKLLSQLSDQSLPLRVTVGTFIKSLPFKRRVMKVCKDTVKLLPSGLISSAKALFYSLKK